MFYYQYLIMLVLLYLCCKAPNKGAFILLMGYIFHEAVNLYGFSEDKYIYYYSVSMTINLIIGYLLQKHSLSAAICSYGLVFVNIYGALLWYAYLPHDAYDSIFAVILFIQLIVIIPIGVLNGFTIHRTTNKRNVDGPTRFDGGEKVARMYKNTAKKEATQ